MPVYNIRLEGCTDGASPGPEKKIHEQLTEAGASFQSADEWNAGSSVHLEWKFLAIFTVVIGYKINRVTALTQTAGQLLYECLGTLAGRKRAGCDHQYAQAA